MFGFHRRNIQNQDVRALKEAAFRYMQKGRWHKALAHWEELVRREPAELQHRIRLGECLRHLGRTKEASRHWFKAASGWAASHRWDKAIAACRLALSDDPFDVDVIRLLDTLEQRRRGAVPEPVPEPQPVTPWLSPRGEARSIDVAGWNDDHREVQRARSIPASPPVLVPDAPPPGIEPVAVTPQPFPAEDDAMPESVFEDLHAAFSSARPTALTPDTAPRRTPNRRIVHTFDAPPASTD